MQAPFGRARRVLAIPALLLALTAGFYWKLTLTRQFSWAEAEEQANQTVPWMDFQAREIHAQRLPLWDPHQGAGEDLIGQVQPGAANPLNWVLFALPLRQGHIRPLFLNWYWVLLHWLAALTAYALCREVGAGRTGAVLGAAAFGLSGLVGASMSPQWTSGALWLPLVLRYFLRISGAGPAGAAAAVSSGAAVLGNAALGGAAAVSSGAAALGNAALGGAALGLAFLSGHMQIPLFAAVVMVGLWTAALAADGFRSRRIWASAGVFALVCVLVGGLQTLPAIELAQRAVSPAAVWPMPDVGGAGARVALGTIIPGWAAAANPFVGVVAMAFALVGLVATWSRRETRVLTAVTAAGFVGAIGGDSIYCGMLQGLLPAVARAGSAGTAVALAHVGIAALAALGFDAWPQFRAQQSVRRGVLSIGTAIFALYTVFAVARIVPADQRPMVTGLAALLLAGVLYAWEHGETGTRAAGVLAIGLTLLEAGTVSSFSIAESTRPDSRLQRMTGQEDIGDFLKLQPGWFRVEVEGNEIPYRFGDRFGVNQALVANDADRRRLGVRYYVGRQAQNATQASQFHSRTGLKVFRDPDAGAAAFTVHDSTVPGTPAGLQPCAQADDVAVESRMNRFVVVRARMSCRGVLAMAEAAAPGWRVWVDRRPGKLRTLYGGLRGVALEAGNHRVEFRYTPAPVYWGGGMTAAGFALAAWLAWRGSRRPAN
jgi:hypothetical protein